MKSNVLGAMTQWHYRLNLIGFAIYVKNVIFILI